MTTTECKNCREAQKYADHWEAADKAYRATLTPEQEAEYDAYLEGGQEQGPDDDIPRYLEYDTPDYDTRYQEGPDNPPCRECGKVVEW